MATIVGVFHESGGMRRVLTELRPNRIEDIIAVTALYRPGPMANIPHYIARKAKSQSCTTIPKLEATLKETYGIFVIRNRSNALRSRWPAIRFRRADLLRRAMGKKKPEVMAKERLAFVEGCAKTSGMSAGLANKIFDTMTEFANYGFNNRMLPRTAWSPTRPPISRPTTPPSSCVRKSHLEIGNFDKLRVHRGGRRHGSHRSAAGREPQSRPLCP